MTGQIGFRRSTVLMWKLSRERKTYNRLYEFSAEKTGQLSHKNYNLFQVQSIIKRRSVHKQWSILKSDFRQTTSTCSRKWTKIKQKEQRAIKLCGICFPIFNRTLVSTLHLIQCYSPIMYWVTSTTFALSLSVLCQLEHNVLSSRKSTSNCTIKL